MTRILFFGDLIAVTGFGVVTFALGKGLLDLGHDVRFVSGTGGLDDELPEPFHSRTFRISEGMIDPDHPETLRSLVELGVSGLINGLLWEDGWTPEACIILGDPGNVRLVVEADDRTKAAFASVPTFHYVPIEGVDLPPTWRELWTHTRPVAMSEFGAAEIEKIMGKRPPVVYHGVDTTQFRPITNDRPMYTRGQKIHSKEQAKRSFGAGKETRILLRTDRNMPRKRYPSLFRALAPVLARNPDTILVCHCLRFDQGGDLTDVLTKFPPGIRNRIIITNGQVSRDALTVMYNMADVYVGVAAEGFGLTYAEALACEVPAVGLEYSSVPEVIGPGGLVVPIAGLIDNQYGYYWAVADEARFGQAVAELLDNPSAQRALGRAGRQHVLRNFQWDKASILMSGLIHDAVNAVAA